MQNSGKVVNQAGAIRLRLTDNLSNEGAEALINSGGSLKIDAKKVTNSGTITGGVGENKLEATELTNSGTINSLGDWQRIATTRLTNSGTLGANEGLSVETDNLSNPGTISGGTGLTKVPEPTVPERPIRVDVNAQCEFHELPLIHAVRTGDEAGKRQIHFILKRYSLLPDFTIITEQKI